MNKLRLLVFICLFANGATASTVDDVVNRYINAWNAHDKAGIASFYAEDVAWYDLPSDTKVIGKEKVAPAIINYFMGYVPDMYWYKSGDVYASGNTLVYEWIYGGTFNGKWGEKTIKNKTFSLKGLSTTTVNHEGKIIAQKDYYDVNSFKRAIGVTP